VTTIARIRTDLDAFSPEEIGILENHGYLAADASVRLHA
jgi:NTE family protein